ncbi:tRNA/rRNA methyltransferase (SpoU) [Gloeothece citriformis PCC 7424]|uniref:tRNA/rRNA methyltransferase (SpoU) n=1 Tax=Gloeothece citriformis (strain PCC 7424) TaxID=65393 RepID=B7KCC7_GLOC7|nr:RNA methyltransferase [Gloeothece citriformis]ACK70232.1 tRNA/rRNA methyltransferase (SpoU) [Gloeothece citriformis PCC 7424]
MITSLQNPLIKQMRKLHRPKGRREQNLFLIEGTHLLETACSVNSSLDVVCCTPQWQTNHKQLWEKAQSLAQRTEVVTPEVLAAIATTINPDGVVASATRIFEDSLAKSPLSLGLMLERLQDPGNLGTIIRTAVATEVDQLWLTHDSVDLDNPKVLRASAGEWFRVPMRVSDNLGALIEGYKRQQVQVIGTLPQGNKTYWEIDFTRPTLILLGNEGAGLTPELVSLVDQQVTIPLGGGVESLNVAIAAALLLYEAKRQKQLTIDNG